jgi:excisionase family DNA binding protein
LLGDDAVRKELAAALDAARSMPVEDLPRLLGELAEITATAQSRLYSPPTTPIEDRLLDVTETATRLHCSEDYLYRHHKKLPFTRSNHVGGKLLFSSAALDAYLKKSR